MKTNTNTIVPFSVEGGRLNNPSNQESLDSGEEAHEQLLCFLKSGGGIELGITRKKYLERGELRPSEDVPGKFILSVERHRAILGDTYQEGLPMASFETYTQELIFDPAVPSLTRMNEIHLDYTIDVHALASEHMTDYTPTVEMSHGASLRKIKLSVINWDMTTSSLTEAQDEVEEQIRNICLEGIFEYLDGVYDAYPCIESEFLDACVEHVLNRLDEAWNDPEMLDDE